VSGQSLISPDILASYAADAAREVAGVSGLVGSALHRHDGVRVSLGEERVAVELHLAVAWGASAPEVAAAVQERVAEYLTTMADVRPGAVDVVVDEFAPQSDAT
jgi:uncharacterized alkaline shock family protein YloU